ncbi:MAG TPA: methionine biosynthesis protein MetW [Bryobacteraceae bacterium]|nr:methionine biosynthesis protein MetW [Bryobacteraceae bacterium]
MTTATAARTGPFVRKLLGRSDFAIISEIVAPNSKVLDLGCGDGELLAWLAEHKNVDARGVEISGQRVQRAIARGVSVYQGDIEEAVTDLPDATFDYVVLSQTLQETKTPLKVLREMLRVGRRAIVAFPNFGHWTVRLAHLWTGRAPKTRLFPHDWYDSPNIHFLTIDDFENLATREGWIIERRIYLQGQRRVTIVPNLLAEVAVYEVTRRAE